MGHKISISFSLLLVLTICSNCVFSQVEKLDGRIVKKIKKDPHALNLRVNTLERSDLGNVDSFEFDGVKKIVRANKPDTSYSYQVFYQYDSIGTVSPVYVEEIKSWWEKTKGLYERLEIPHADSNAFLGPSQLVSMRLSGHSFYYVLVRAIERNPGPNVGNYQRKFQTNIGFASEDNSDAIRSAAVNTTHRYPTGDIPSSKKVDRTKNLQGPDLGTIDSAVAILHKVKITTDSLQSTDGSILEQALAYSSTFFQNQLALLDSIGRNRDSTGRRAIIVDTLVYELNSIRSSALNRVAKATELDGSKSGATFDISFAGISYSHRFLYSPNALGLAGFGFEISTGDGVLNMLPMQSPLVHWGGRFLVDFSDNGGNLRDAVFADVGVLVRSPLNTRKIIERLGLNGTGSLMHIDLPKLNITSGTTIDISLFTGSVGLPPLNFYFSTGSMDFSHPPIYAGDASLNTAYFSDTQWEATISFHWNSEASRTNRFKLDLGAGGYDIWSVLYRDSKTDVYDHNELIGLMQFLPVVALTYTHESPKALFGGSIRLFDNRPSLIAWIKILKSGGNELRLESKFISGAIGRLVRSWETGSSSMLQLRFRRNF